MEANASLQSELRVFENKSQQYEQKISALKEAEVEFRIEKETEIENLNKQVDSMKKRQERSNNEQMANLEDENKKMVKEVTLLETKVNKLERENKQTAKKLVEAKEVFSHFVQWRARKFKKSPGKKNSILFFCEIAFLAVLNFLPVQKLIFGHF